MLPDARGTGGCLVGGADEAVLVMENSRESTDLHGIKCNKRSRVWPLGSRIWCKGKEKERTYGCAQR